MVGALVAGTTNPVLADLARGALRKKLPALRQALAGRFRAHHALLMAPLLAHLDYLEEMAETLSTQIEVVIALLGEEVARLDTIHAHRRGDHRRDRRRHGRLPRRRPPRQLGTCSGNNESAGKHRPGTTRKGNTWLREAFPEAALAAGTRSAEGAFAARYRRVMQHRGHKKAVIRKR